VKLLIWQRGQTGTKLTHHKTKLVAVEGANTALDTNTKPEE